MDRRMSALVGNGSRRYVPGRCCSARMSFVRHPSWRGARGREVMQIDARGIKARRVHSTLIRLLESVWPINFADDESPGAIFATCHHTKCTITAMLQKYNAKYHIHPILSHHRMTRPLLLCNLGHRRICRVRGGYCPSFRLAAFRCA
jgi:hypothetical protein